MDAYRHPDDDGFLPQHFCLNNIAQLINNNAKACVGTIGFPRINRIAGRDSLFESLAEDEFPYCLVQGYQPQIFRAEQSRDHGFANCGSDRRTPDRRGDRVGAYGDRKAGPSQGCYACPDQRRRPFQPGVQRDAYKRIGHTANSCDMLAIALYVDRYIKDMPDSDRKILN
jgi:hypothetical protein